LRDAQIVEFLEKRSDPASVFGLSLVGHGDADGESESLAAAVGVDEAVSQTTCVTYGDGMLPVGSHTRPESFCGNGGRGRAARRCGGEPDAS
jgi:hypothetical protein